MGYVKSGILWDRSRLELHLGNILVTVEILPPCNPEAHPSTVLMDLPEPLPSEDLGALGEVSSRALAQCAPLRREVPQSRQHIKGT